MIDVGESIGLHNDCSNTAPWQSQQHELPLRLACSVTSRGKDCVKEMGKACLMSYQAAWLSNIRSPFTSHHALNADTHSLTSLGQYSQPAATCLLLHDSPDRMISLGSSNTRGSTNHSWQQTPDWTEHTCGNIGQGRDGCYMLQAHWAGQILCNLHEYHSTVHIVDEAEQRRRPAQSSESCDQH